MKYFQLALALFASVTIADRANAAIYHYTYEGIPLSCPGDLADDPYCEPFSGMRFSGRMAIDEGQLPGKSLANSRVTVDFTYRPFGRHNAVQSILEYEVAKGDKVYSGSKTNRSFNETLLPFLWSVFAPENDGDRTFGEYLIAQSLFHSIDGETSGISFKFDGKRRIVEWGIGSWQGGSDDYSISGNSGDSVSGGAWAPPGTWTLTDIQPAYVPLPAALPASMTGIAAIFAVGRRRRRRAPSAAG